MTLLNGNKPKKRAGKQNASESDKAVNKKKVKGNLRQTGK